MRVKPFINAFVLSLTFVVLSSQVLSGQQGQSSQPAKSSQNDTIQIPELEYLKWENIQLKLRSLQQAVEQFQANAKLFEEQIRKESSDLRTELLAAENDIYTKAKVKPDDYQIDPVKKALTRRQPAAEPSKPQTDAGKQGTK